MHLTHSLTRQQTEGKNPIPFIQFSSGWKWKLVLDELQQSTSLSLVPSLTSRWASPAADILRILELNDTAAPLTNRVTAVKQIATVRTAVQS